MAIETDALPVDLGVLVGAAVPAVAGELVAVLAPAIPRMDGRFGRDVVRAVADALHDFASVLEHPPPAVGADRALYVALGERWFRSGRSLDELQAAYHLGARVVWRRIAAVATAAAADGATLAALADALFAYLDEIAAVTVEGFVAAQAGEAERRRARLLSSLLAGEPVADDAGWPLPRTLAAVVVGGRAPPCLPPDVLRGTADALTCLLVPDPDGPGRRAQLAAALAGTTATLGPTVTPASAPRSWTRARALWHLLGAGAPTGAADRAREGGASGGRPLPPRGLVAADDHLLDLLLAHDPALVADLARARLPAFVALPARSRERLEQTLLAYLRQRGNGPRMAADLHVHPQTVRYRIAQLRELLGDALDDPDARFEIEVVLRARRQPMTLRTSAS